VTQSVPTNPFVLSATNFDGTSFFTEYHCILRFDTRRYFNVQSKADKRQLNSTARNRQLKSGETEKLKKVIPRDDMLVRYMLWSCVRLSVCLSVCLCLSVTSRSSAKTAEHRITQTYHTIAQGISFLAPIDLMEILPRSPPAGAPNAGGLG